MFSSSSKVGASHSPRRPASTRCKLYIVTLELLEPAVGPEGSRRALGRRYGDDLVASR
jgi:hypothetical protein